MRIAFLTTEFAGIGHHDGGLGNYLRRMTRLLAARGHEPEVFLCNAALAPAAEDALAQQDGVPVRHLAGAPVGPAELAGLPAPDEVKLPVFGAWRLAEALAARHAQAPFDAVQVTNCGLPGLFLDVAAPVVMRLSSYEPLLRQALGAARSPGQGALEILERQAILAADAHYAPSRFLADHVRSALRLAVAVIRPPAYLEARPESWDRAWWASVTQNARPYFACLGTLSLLKGADLLAQALPLFWRDCPDVHVHLVGRDAGGHGLWENVKGASLQRLHYHGLQPHARVYPLLADALASVVPARVDNLPNTAIESLLTGTPAVGMRGTSLEELLKDGRGGVLVPPGSPTALADALAQLARMSPQERGALGASGKAFVERELEPNGAADRLVEFAAAARARTAAGRVPRAVRMQALCQDLCLLYQKEWLAPALKSECDRWRRNYENLAGAFPVKQLLWLRRRLARVPDPPKADSR